jgi:Short C-terminal domain
MIAGMFMARRRPLLGAAMIGGGAYVMGKRKAQAQEAEAQQEQSQDDRISALEQQQPQQPQQAAAPAAAPAAGGSIVDKLKELTDMKTSGALTDAQFEQAKAQLLGGG